MPELADAISELDYHSDFSAVSRSMLSTFKESPRLYWELYVAKIRKPEPTTPAMIRGTRFDCLLLMPDEFERKYAVTSALAPDGEPWDRRRTAHKAAWAYELQRIGDREPVTDAEMAELVAMREGAMRNPELRRMIETAGEVQVRLDWTDETFGLACKALLDKRFADAGYILDVKTAGDPCPEAFARSIVSYGYHRQDAWYSEGMKQISGMLPRFLFGVVGSKPPYDAAVYELDESAKRAGLIENMGLLNRLCERMVSGDWEPSWSKAPVTLELPRWYDPNRNEVSE